MVIGDTRETICALATAPGRSGIAVVRLSGTKSFDLIGKLFRPEVEGGTLPARRAVLGKILDPNSGEELDQAMVTCFPGPHSYTGEDVVEISLHGSPVLVSALLDRLCESGARLAEPGEFTMRSFLTGRMDLAQAEAVRDVIDATTLYQAQIAARQRSGELSRCLEPIKQGLIDIIVNLESAVEFVEEDLPVESGVEIAARLAATRVELAKLIDSFRKGRIIRDGFSMAVVGRTNVGKSSLFNALLAQERSIVTAIPGTTRDLVSEFTQLAGIPIRLLDTAGIRNSEDPVEKIGVERTLSAMADADAILLVVDRSRDLSSEDLWLRNQLRDLSCIVVMNKIDLPSRWSMAVQSDYAWNWPRVEVSARTGMGIDVLRSMIMSRLLGDDGSLRDGILVTNLRHCRALEGTHAHLTAAGNALNERLSEEFILYDLHAALRKLGEITGETMVEDLLGEIFSRFCVGK